MPASVTLVVILGEHVSNITLPHRRRHTIRGALVMVVTAALLTAGLAPAAAAAPEPTSAATPATETPAPVPTAASTPAPPPAATPAPTPAPTTTPPSVEQPATTATPHAEAAPARPTGTVRGTVYAESALGATIRGATVELVGEYVSCEGIGEDLKTRVSTTTASDGTYRFDSVPTFVSCSDDPDDRSSLRYVVKVLPNVNPPTLQQLSSWFAVRADTTSTVDVAAPLGVSVTGKVYLPTGERAVNAVVRSENSSAVVRTDGSFSIAGIEGGTFTLSFTADGAPPMTREFTAATGERITGVRIDLLTFPTAEGRVTSSSGSPLAGIRVAATYPSGGLGTTTDADGRYSVGPFPDGAAVTLTFTDPSDTYARRTIGPQTAHAGEVLALSPALKRYGSISGTVVANAVPLRPLAGVRVKLYTEGSKLNQYSYSVTTGSDGRYTLPKVAPGDYLVSFEGDSLGLLTQWWKRSPNRDSGVVVTLGDATVATGIDATMDDESSLSSVTGAVTLQGSPARPATGTKVTLKRLGDGAAIYSTRVGATGEYTLPDVMSGTYLVLFEPSDGDFLPQYLGGFSDAGGSTQLTVAPRATVTGIDAVLKPKLTFTSAPKPVIIGLAEVGSTLTVQTGTWSPTPDLFRFKWLRNGVEIPGSTGTSYTVRSYDAGATISVSVRATKGSKMAQTQVSAWTAKVTQPLTDQSSPIIAGTVKVGATLTAKTGDWGPAPVTFAYVWKRDGVAISGATAKTYVLKSADQAKRISVTVTASKPGYTTVSKNSSSTIKVLGALSASPVPTLTGTAKQGSTLTAKSGIWGPSPVTLTYTWERNGVPVAGATGKTFVLKAADVGKKITVSVTGAKSGYASITRTSAPTGTIAAG